jgi:hypothetical protein
MVTSIVYPDRPSGYSQDQLAKAFDRVRVSRDWKGPIRAEIPATEERVVQAALLWLGSTVPTFTAVPGSPNRLVVTASL